MGAETKYTEERAVCFLFVPLALRVLMVAKLGENLAVFTQLTRPEMVAILDVYGLTLASFSPIESGGAHSNFWITTTTGKYVLTVYERPFADGVILARALAHLEESAFPAPRLTRSKNGELVTQLSGKVVLLKPFIAGEIKETLTGTQLFQAGQALAQLHRLPPPEFLPTAHPYVGQTLPPVQQQATDEGYKKWVDERVGVWEQKRPYNLPRGFIHGDLFTDNILFLDDELQAIIDFEDVCHHVLGLDVGMAILGLCRMRTDISLGQTRSFLVGYQSVRPFTSDEKSFLLQFVIYATTLTSTWRYWKYFIESPHLPRRHKYEELVQFANGLLAMGDDAFVTAVLG